ncbi:uncharacterized protein LOC117815811 isoform X2 [Notolabrus celidotus]|uniref:uncharacterized protein LOC117815811 isoform X2 n=1 Tax=Notolabrus celidotus TaxID=1203425 RepID=UPI00148F4BFC|nr:uncharacterized protein LOC117815811 isoform X2 [Notolabrus celidotus]
MDVEVLGEPDNEESNNLPSEKREHSGGDEAELYRAESTGILPAFPGCVSQNRWGIGGGEGGRGGGGEVGEDIQSSMLEYLVCLDNRHNMADCSVTRTTSLPVTPETQKPCTVIPVPGSVLYPMLPSPTADAYTPITSMCSPTDSAWDTLRSTSGSPGSFGQDPVRAAAHLHLLGESLSLIGQYLQETNKTVSVPSSLSLLLDSLLCALVPLISLTSQIPELRNCTQHTLASTLENINYLMPGL